MEDAKIAVQTGVDGLDVVIGTSSYLREHSHGKDMTYIKNAALEASLPYTEKEFLAAQEKLCSSLVNTRIYRAGALEGSSLACS